MCVLIHKPSGRDIPRALIEAAASLNRDGWGFMGVGANGEAFAVRHAIVDAAGAVQRLEQHRDSELVVHFRLLTRGSTQEDNLHPFFVNGSFWLMHNGTLPIEAAQAGRSDSWALAHEVLGPLVQQDAEWLWQPALRPLIELALGDSRMAVLRRESPRLAIFNRHLGREIDGVWISNTRWLDARLYPIPAPAVAQERAYRADELVFL